MPSTAEVDWLVRTLGLEPDDACYVSGSMFDGFGNATSDFDVFVVTESIEVLAGRASADIARFRGADRGLLLLQPDPARPRFDVECYTWALIGRLADRLRRTGDGLASLDDAHAIGYDDLDFLHRLKIGVPLANPEAMVRLREMVVLGRLSELLAARRLGDYERQAEDAVGAMASDQWRTAFLSARAALEAAFDAYLAKLGETYVSPKWKFEKALRRFGDADPLFTALWELETNGPHDIEPARAWVRRALRLAQKLAVLTEGTPA